MNVSLLGVSLLLVIAVVAVASFWHWRDRHTDRTAWQQLVQAGVNTRSEFDSTLIAGLPEPAQRYFRFMIREGTPLATVAEIDMRGELCLGTRDKPNCRQMHARQVLSPPYGFVWSLRAGALSGADGIVPETSWTRFWLLGLIPIVRAGGNSDHWRSAFGRVVSEAAFWVPASLLPSSNVRWEALGDDAARAIVNYGVLQQAVDITVADNGQPVKVTLLRWSNENDDKQFREQPFGGELFDFQDFAGYTLPTRVIGGNHIGTEDYFPFYRATVTAVAFPNLRAATQ